MDFSFDSLSGVLDLVGDAGTATGKIAQSVDTVKSLFQKAEAGGNAEIKLALSELTEQVANAKMANADLKLKLATLQKELAKAQAFQNDLDRYALWKTPAGAFVYRLKEDSQGAEPLHFLCPNCISDHQKSILQGEDADRQCPRCSTWYSFSTKDWTFQSPTPNPTDGYRF
jgi:rubrerythrin